MDAVIRNVKRICNAGLDSVSLRRELAARLKPVIGFDAHAFSACDPDTGLIAHTVAEGVPQMLARAYIDRFYPEGCSLFAMDLPRHGETVFSMLDVSRELRQMHRDLGMEFELYVGFPDQGRLWGSWCLLREHGQEAAATREQALLRRLVPTIAQGMRTAALVDRAVVSTPAPVDGAPGVLVIDGRNGVKLRTSAVEAYLADLADVGFPVAYELPTSVLAVAAQLRHKGADVVEDARVRARGQSGRWYILRASLAMPDASGESATVVVIRPASPREVAGVLTKLYGLSAREREVVAAVARGETTKEIAASLGVSPHTILEHVERACRKIGVRGRKALVAKLFVEGYLPKLMPRSTAAQA